MSTTTIHKGHFSPALELMPEEGKSRYLLGTDQELTAEQVHQHFGPHADPQVVKDLGFRWVIDYRVIDKKGIGHIWAPEPHYPVISVKNGEYEKLIFRAETDKSKRFKLCSELDDNLVINLDRLRQRWEQIVKDRNQDDRTSKLYEDGYRYEKWSRVVLCSGDRDAANVASCGLEVVWRNSEGIWPAWAVKELSKYFHEIFIVGDLDRTGALKAHENCDRYLDLKRIYLPASLMEKKDIRGHQRKDVTDYIELHGRESFLRLLNTARPYKIFSYKIKVDKDGAFKEATPEIVKDYIGAFLREHGFFWLKEEADEWLVKRTGNIIEQFTVNQVRGFVIKYYEDRSFGLQVRELLKRTGFIRQSIEEDLPILENISTNTGGPDQQVLVFEKKTWHVTADKIGQHEPGALDKMVFKDQVIAPKVKGGKPIPMRIDKPYFEVKADENGRPVDIEILNYSSRLLQFFSDTSRIYHESEFQRAIESGCIAQAELYRNREFMETKQLHTISGELLTESERATQKMHLIAKLTCFGFFLWTFKHPDQSYGFWLMDAAMKNVKDSNGRSGKSLMVSAWRKFLTYRGENGRNPKLTDKNHLFDKVTKHTRMIVIDDALPWSNFTYFYPWITDTMTVNPKNKETREIPYEESPKMGWTSNYGPPRLDGSSFDRLWIIPFSDFFHSRITDDGKVEIRKPSDYYGGRLFDDFTPDEWCQTFNLAAQCIQLALKYGKVNPPLEAILKREAANQVGDSLREWLDAEVLPFMVNDSSGRGKIGRNEDGTDAIPQYLAREINGEIYINSKTLFQRFKEESGDRDISQTKFNDRMRKWASQIHKLEVNPTEKCQKDRSWPVKNFPNPIPGKDDVNAQAWYLRRPAPVSTSKGADEWMKVKPEELPY